MYRKNKINRNKSINNSTKLPKIVWLGIAAFTLFLASTILIAVQTATIGAKIAKIESQEQSLVIQNNEIAGRLIEASSLVDISENAEKLGFVKPRNIVYSQGCFWVHRQRFLLYLRLEYGEMPLRSGCYNVVKVSNRG